MSGIKRDRIQTKKKIIIINERKKRELVHRYNTRTRCRWLHQACTERRIKMAGRAHSERRGVTLDRNTSDPAVYRQLWFALNRHSAPGTKFIRRDTQSCLVCVHRSTFRKTSDAGSRKREAHVCASSVGLSVSLDVPPAAAETSSSLKLEFEICRIDGF